MGPAGQRLALALAAAAAATAAACGGDGAPTGTGAPRDSSGTAAPMQEARALWVNRFEYGPSAAKIAEIMRQAADAGFNVVYFQVRGQSDAWYHSDLEPCPAALCGTLGNGYPAWDPLAVAVREAHDRGLQLHAWLNAFTGSSVSSTPGSATCAQLVPSRAGFPTHVLVAHPDWAMVSSAGVAMTCQNSVAYESAWVSPGVPAARTHVARVAADVVRRYAVDGIHLDRIRYPGPAHSYDAPSLAAFRARTGRSDTPAAGDAAWVAFRQEQVNLAVHEIHDSVTAVRRPVVLSAATWGIYQDRWGWNSSEGLDQYFQDPRAWAAAGDLDVAAPMTYFTTKATRCSYADWACLLDDQLALIQGPPANRHAYIATYPHPMTDDESSGSRQSRLVQQIRAARAAGAKGVSVYSYGGLTAGMWSALASDVFATPATVPAMPWKAQR